MNKIRKHTPNNTSINCEYTKTTLRESKTTQQIQNIIS